MDRLQRIYRLHQIIGSRKLPVSLCVLQEKLECSRATVNRIIVEIRLYFNAPLKYDREHNGYYYDLNEEATFKLPGVWVTASELYALLTTQQLLEQAQPGLLDSQLKPLKDRLEKILASEHLGSGEISKRVRILRMAGRNVSNQHFQTVAAALLQRKRIAIRYNSRSTNTETQREISPQRLTHYREKTAQPTFGVGSCGEAALCRSHNWYLDAWCHQRNGLRSFAVDRLQARKHAG